MIQAGISGMWLCCRCDAGKPVLVEQDKPEIEMKCIYCRHMKCYNCSFLGFTGQPQKGFEFSERIAQCHDHITLYLSSKERHFKCDVPKSSPYIEAQSQQQNGSGYDLQSSSTIVPFPEFRLYKKRMDHGGIFDDRSSEASESHSDSDSDSDYDPELNINPPNAPTAIPQPRTASPEDTTPTSNRQPIIIPWTEQLSSESYRSSEPANAIPDNTHSTQQEDRPSGMEQGTSIYIHTPTQQGPTATNHLSPQFERRTIYKGNIASGSTRAVFGNIYSGNGMFQAPAHGITSTVPLKHTVYHNMSSSTIETSSYKPVLETTPQQYDSTHSEGLYTENKPAASSSHETSVRNEQNDLPADESRPQSSVSTVVGTKPPIPATSPTGTATRDTVYSALSRLGKRKPSPRMLAPRTFPRFQRSHFSEPAVPGPPSTPPAAFPVTPSAIFPPVSESPRTIDPLFLERVRRPYVSAPNPSPDRVVGPLRQEVSLQPGEGSSSTPVVLPPRRPVSPAIRPAKIIRRQKPL